MFFTKKPTVYLQFLDQSIRYLTTDTTNGTIQDIGERLLDKAVLDGGEIIHPILLKNHLKALVQEKKWKNAQTHILLPNDFLVLREETIPAALAGEEIHDYLELHIGHSIRIPYDQPIFDYQVIKQMEEQQTILLLAYPEEQITAYENLLEQVSLKPTVADINSLSLYRVAAENKMIEPAAHTLLIEWNPYENTLMVYHENRPTFYRQNQLTHLVSAWTQEPAGQWKWEYSTAELETAINEQFNSLERFLNFYNYSVLQEDERVTDLILAGYYPDLKALKEKIRARFSMRVSLLEVPDQIPSSFDALYGLTLKEKQTKAKSILKKTLSKRRKKKAGGTADD